MAVTCDEVAQIACHSLVTFKLAKKFKGKGNAVGVLEKLSAPWAIRALVVNSSSGDLLEDRDFGSRVILDTPRYTLLQTGDSTNQ